MEIRPFIIFINLEWVLKIFPAPRALKGDRKSWETNLRRVKFLLAIRKTTDMNHVMNHETVNNKIILITSTVKNPEI